MRSERTERNRRMRPDILPQLVNGPEGDPAVYANFKYERRAILFDMGSLHALSARSLLKLTHVFISHTHVDHFIGFDQVLRLHLGRGKTLSLYGPPGFADHVEAKLRGYSWNLVENYPYDFRLSAYEVGEGTLQAASFACRERFARTPLDPLEPLSGNTVILDEPGLRVSAILLEHDIPCLAFALEEKQHINVDKVRLEALGLQVGPWIRQLKDAVMNGVPETSRICIPAPEQGGAAKEMSLGALRDEIVRVSRGQKIAYVTDAAYSDVNVERIVRLVRDADVLFCEAAFSEEDRTRADERRHLTAHQAGSIARKAGVRRLVPFHFSPKYHGRIEDLYEEASRAFGREVLSWRA
jgi:ribonuclease Z